VLRCFQANLRKRKQRSRFFDVDPAARTKFGEHEYEQENAISANGAAGGVTALLIRQMLRRGEMRLARHFAVQRARLHALAAV